MPMFDRNWCFALCLLYGCGNAPPPPPAVPTVVKLKQLGLAMHNDPKNLVKEGRADSGDKANPPALEPVKSPNIPNLPTISLGGGGGTGATTKTVTKSPAEERAEVLQAMQPLQILLGTWNGVTHKEFNNAKATEKPEWVWDFKTDRQHPSLVMKSDKSHYFSEARVTYVAATQKFQFTTRDTEGKDRKFDGDFTDAPRDFEGDDGKTHHKFKLQFTEEEVPDSKDQLVVLFNQQDNNRYLMEVSKKKSNGLQKVDVVGTQRAGTSFAANDADYKDRMCVVSGGLGTTTVSYKGKSYYVCCTGCKAAFEDDPATWIAEFEAKRKKMMP